jgi:hypothetical protein
MKFSDLEDYDKLENRFDRLENQFNALENKLDARFNQLQAQLNGIKTIIWLPVFASVAQIIVAYFK